MNPIAGRQPRTRLDLIAVVIFVALVLIGWLNIYAALYDPDNTKSILDFSQNSGKQLIWMGAAVCLIIFILTVNYHFFISFAYIIYGASIVLLLVVLAVGKEVNGAKAWLQVGSFTLQPSEFAKFATSLVVARLLSNPLITGPNEEKKPFDKRSVKYMIASAIGFPALLILLQKDTGSAMVFSAFLIPLYREGMSPFIILLGLALVVVFILTFFTKTWLLVALLALIFGAVLLGLFYFRRPLRHKLKTIIFAVLCLGVASSSEYIMKKLPKHQSSRIRILMDPASDPLGVGWNITQSKIAIGSGGLWGKGFLEGTQTKGDFVPEQDTDFIFCTIGEEHGWIGSLVVISLFLVLLWRILMISERQKVHFARIYGYCVAGIIFFHFMINIGMAIGLFPVIGIPLPFFSYGGSSLWGFTVLLFVLLKFDAQRSTILTRL